MKTLYFECGMGAAGDMLMSALLELLPEQEHILEQLNSIGLPHVVFMKHTEHKCGIVGTRISVTVNGQEEDALQNAHEHHHDNAHHHHHHDDDVVQSAHEHHRDDAHHHHHAGMQEIEALIGGLSVSPWVKENALAVYRIIAEAESAVHGTTVTQIHFHEVGTLDAAADIVGVCVLLEALSPARIVASPVHVGSGHVHCMHGVLPVPAPATAQILLGVPTYGGSVKGELCTPTGAALLKHFVQSFGDMPLMAVSAIGYGMGTRDFGRANCLRAMLGETTD